MVDPSSFKCRASQRERKKPEYLAKKRKYLANIPSLSLFLDLAQNSNPIAIAFSRKFFTHPPLPEN
jgi:hypothetical protein